MTTSCIFLSIAKTLNIPLALDFLLSLIEFRKYLCDLLQVVSYRHQEIYFLHMCIQGIFDNSFVYWIHYKAL